MPGDNVQMKVKLIAPIAMEQGLRFAISVPSGSVTEPVTSVVRK